MTLCFPDEIDEHETFAKIEDIVDGAVPRDEYVDEMLDELEPNQEIAPLSSLHHLISSGCPSRDRREDSVRSCSEDHRGWDTEIVDFGTADQPRELRIRSDLSIDDREIALSSCSEHTWTFSHGPIRTCQALIHLCPASFATLPHARPLMVEYPEWLANVVPVPKKDGKVLMVPEDMEKTSFITEWGTYCYRVMPFGLKNAGATYQRAATTLFHDMMHRDVEVYVDDMIVKSQDRPDHLAALKRFFERIRQFRLRLNPKKCTFGVTSGKLLGYIVSERGIEVDPDKIRVILDMRAPRTEREVRGFLGRLYVSTHSRGSESTCCHPSLGASYTRSSFTPIPIHLNVALGCMLAQLDDSGKDRAIYYLMHLISRLDPLRYLFDRPALVGRLMRWLVLLTEFNIHYVTQKSIRGSIVTDHLASLPVSDAEPLMMTSRTRMSQL
ncbi:Retrovirus-related Pol polyprotein from transposon opus [Vitis vinifera]|uniref:Retrovirus-related Pol polyprotein from transposon opus n=1 Tax=Vitis vinifera TaxID=29760 RepID=A0A438D6T8_VITVI|nr:Retrovirus-related Pol polyprotein from transposon opus [Vitis vinifera]